MPRGPQGQKRPNDVVGAAVMVGRIATRQIEETYPDLRVLRAARQGLSPLRQSSGLRTPAKLPMPDGGTQIPPDGMK